MTKEKLMVGEFTRPSFCVVGFEGSSDEGAGFIKPLWEQLNARLDELEPFAVKSPTGTVCPYGCMSDMSRSYNKWEDNLSRGLYLAGVEVKEGTVPPEGFTMWRIPSFDYYVIEMDSPDTIAMGLEYIESCGKQLVGAIQEMYYPAKNKCYLLFPVGRH